MRCSLPVVAALLFLGVILGRGAASGRHVVQLPQVEAVADVDLSRYAGVWYEISRFPNWFQSGCAGEVTATYRLRDDGRIDVINECSESGGTVKRAEGIAKLADQEGPASKLKVRFAPGILSWLPFVWADYWVLYLDDDYTRVAVGTPDRDYLWILSRTPQITDDEYRVVVGRVEEMGYSVERLERTRPSR